MPARDISLADIFARFAQKSESADGLIRGAGLEKCLADFRRKNGRKTRGVVYIDGLNFYNQAPLCDTPFKWLDLREWARKALPSGCEPAAVHYFTSAVKALDDDPNAPVRQGAYLRALEDWPGRDDSPDLRVHFGASIKEKKRGRPVGEFWGEDFCRRVALAAKRAWARIRRRPPPDSPKAQIQIPVEKQTDVNLAAQMVADAARNRFDFAVLVATDSDYVGACRMVRGAFGKTVLLAVNPKMDRTRGGRGRRRGEQGAESPRKKGVDSLKAEADGVVHILPGALKQSQLPDEFPAANGKGVHRKPREWR